MDCSNGGACAQAKQCKPAMDCSKGGACAQANQSEMLTQQEKTTAPKSDVDVDSGEEASWVKVETKVRILSE